MVTEEALHKFNIDINMKYSCIKSYGLWHTSVEIEWPEKRKLNVVTANKGLSQQIAAKNILRMLAERKIISDTGQIIPEATDYPRKHVTNTNVIALCNIEQSSQRLCSEVSGDCLSVPRRFDNSKSLLNVRNYSSCYSFGQNDHYNQLYNDLVHHDHNMTIRSVHSSSSHDDIRGTNKIAVKINAENENVGISVPSVTVKFKRKKAHEVRRNKSIKLKKGKVIPDVPESHSEDPTSALRDKEIIATKETDELKDLKITSDIYNLSPKDKHNLSEIKDESESSHVSTKKDSNIIPQRELEKIEKRYPQPKGTLNNIYAVVAQELKDCKYKLERSYCMLPVIKGKASVNMWSCTYRVKWPNEATFSSTMPSKALASKQAALQALYWLKIQGKLTKVGAPQLYDPVEIKEMAKIPSKVTIDPALIGDLDALITYHNENILPLLNELQMGKKTTKSVNRCEVEDIFDEYDDSNNMANIFQTTEPTNCITGFSYREIDSKKIDQRNKELYNRYMQRTASPNKEKKESEVLPIAKFKSQIVKMVEENRVLVIKGEPGCGKSTQVPQYLMEHWEASRKGAHCNIIITQPRRISAISLADWVAYERQERVGDVVGYQVRLKAALPKSSGGALLFCSTGILLKRLQSNPGLVGASHVILDEAHEHDINTDMLLVLLRRALSLNPNLHILVMSATINAELFQKYFDGASLLHIPGFTYPVKSIFLEDLHVRRRISRASDYATIDCNLVYDTIKWIDKNRPEGAILCFLPGWAEISSVSALLSEENNNSYCVVPVHSRLSYAEQERIFHVPPPGVRKIILSTNIAESSITINDVKYVIDTGAHKEERLNVHLGVSSLDNHWISKANVRQRRGRAGRVQPGECFHLYTREKFDSLDNFPIPELHRVPLEKTVLDLKTYSQDEKAMDFLSEMPEPPSAAAVAQAVNELSQLGALDENERLTPLGIRIALFSTHPKLSKALVHAAIFKCLSPMLTIATVLSAETELFVGGLSNKENVRSIKSRFHPSSDHLAIAWLYQEWKMINEMSTKDASNFCFERSLNRQSLNLVSKLCKLYADHLWQSEMIEDSDDYKDLNSSDNKYAGNDELVKAVFLSGTGTLLHRRSWDIKNGRIVKDANVIFTEADRRATLTSESVNFKRTDYPSPFLTYFRQVESTERRTVTVRETSLLSPLTVLLFSEGQCVISKFIAPVREEGKWDNHMLMKINRNKRDVYLLCDSSVTEKVLHLREIMWSMIDYFVLKNGIEDDVERYKTMCCYHDRLLKLLSRMLYRSGSLIEYDEEGNLCK